MLKPIDIHNVEFKRVFKGYSEKEVDDFLAKVVSEYEQLFQENKKLRERLTELESAAEDTKKGQDDVYQLITATRQAVDTIKETTNQEAEQVIERARKEAETILADARVRLEQAERRDQEMLRSVNMFKERMREIMEQFWTRLEDETAAASGHNSRNHPTEEQEAADADRNMQDTQVYRPSAVDES